MLLDQLQNEFDGKLQYVYSLASECKVENIKLQKCELILYLSTIEDFQCKVNCLCSVC